MVAGEKKFMTYKTEGRTYMMPLFMEEGAFKDTVEGHCCKKSSSKVTRPGPRLCGSQRRVGVMDTLRMSGTLCLTGAPLIQLVLGAGQEEREFAGKDSRLQ